MLVSALGVFLYPSVVNTLWIFSTVDLFLLLKSGCFDLGFFLHSPFRNVYFVNYVLRGYSGLNCALTILNFDFVRILNFGFLVFWPGCFFWYASSDTQCILECLGGFSQSSCMSA